MWHDNFHELGPIFLNIDQSYFSNAVHNTAFEILWNVRFCEFQDFHILKLINNILQLINNILKLIVGLNVIISLQDNIRVSDSRVVS